MQWSNYLYANGGQYHDKDWKATFNSPAGVKAIEDFKTDIAKHGPAGAESYCFDEASNVFGQGKAYSFVTFNILLSGFNDPKSSQVVGKADIAANPGGGLNGGWGWAIPNSSQEKEAAWTFIKWIESKEIVKKRALEGGVPTQGWVFEDADIIAKRPEMPQLKVLVATAQEFPTFTYTVDFVEATRRRSQIQYGAPDKHIRFSFRLSGSNGLYRWPSVLPGLVVRGPASRWACSGAPWPLSTACASVAGASSTSSGNSGM